MPRRNRRDDDEDDYDDEPRPRRRRKAKPSRTGLIVGLSLGGVFLLAVVITVVVVAVRRPGAGNLGGGGGLFAGSGPRPAGKKALANGQEVDDPAVVDRAWSKLRGRWKEVGGNATSNEYEFLSDYRYRMDFTAQGERMDYFHPVVTITDDSQTAGGKGGEHYTLFSREEPQPGVVATTTMPVTLNPDGTLTLNQKRYRRAN